MMAPLQRDQRDCLPRALAWAPEKGTVGRDRTPFLPGAYAPLVDLQVPQAEFVLVPEFYDQY